MLRQTSSRNHRSKGFKVRHALQICLLLAVFIWLIYQVKHSHDKKKAFDEKNVEVSNSIEGRHEIMKLGRKDLNHGIETVPETEKQGKEDESVVEEEEEIKEEESEDEERGVGDDEIDETDQDKAEEEEQGEDSIDEDEENIEKEESEETENTEKEENEERDGEENEDMGSSEDQEHAKTGMNLQEEHEKLYNGDDASSAVVHSQTIRKVENGYFERTPDEQVDNVEKNDLEDNNTNRTENSNVEDNDSRPEITVVTGDDEKKDNPPINAAINETRGVEVSLSTSEDKSPLNSTTGFNDQTTLYGNSTTNNIEDAGHSPQNKTIMLDSIQDENATIKIETSDQDNSNSKTIEQSEKSNTTVAADKSVDNDASSLTTNKSSDEVQTETTGSSITQEQEDTHTYLRTMPETGHQGKSAEDVAV